MVKEKEARKKAPPSNRPPSPSPAGAVGGNAAAGVLSSTPGRQPPVQRLLAQGPLTPRRDTREETTPKRTNKLKGGAQTPVRQKTGTPSSREAKLSKLEALERVLTYSQRPAEKRGRSGSER